MDTSNPPQADVDREQRKHKYKILRLVLRNVNVLRNIFIPASRFSSHTHEFFHALAKRKRFAEHFHSRITGSYWQLLAVLIRWYLTTGIYNYWQ